VAKKIVAQSAVIDAANDQWFMGPSLCYCSTFENSVGANILSPLKPYHPPHRISGAPVRKTNTQLGLPIRRVRAEVVEHHQIW